MMYHHNIKQFAWNCIPMEVSEDELTVNRLKNKEMPKAFIINLKKCQKKNPNLLFRLLKRKKKNIRNI